MKLKNSTKNSKETGSVIRRQGEWGAAYATFDVVVIANALHIMPAPDPAMKEIYRVLKKGGILFAPTFVYGTDK